MMYLTVAATLTIGNFFYQFMFGDSNWLLAAERSYFQAIAVLFTWWMTK